MLPKKKGLVIVHSSDTRQCAEFLSGLLDEKDSDDIFLNAVVIDAKKFATYTPENKNSKQYIVYIGDFEESKIAIKNITKFRFEQFGIRYGWHGRKAVINFDKQSLSESHFIDMAAFAEKEFKDYELNIRDNVKKNGLNFLRRISEFNKLPLNEKIKKGAVALFGRLPGFVAIAAIDVYDAVKDRDKLNSAQIREQQQKLAVLHFFVFGLSSFLDIKIDEPETPIQESADNLQEE